MYLALSHKLGHQISQIKNPCNKFQSFKKIYYEHINQITKKIIIQK